jgi:hypothetical protein
MFESDEAFAQQLGKRADLRRIEIEGIGACAQRLYPQLEGGFGGEWDIGEESVPVGNDPAAIGALGFERGPKRVLLLRRTSFGKVMLTASHFARHEGQGDHLAMRMHQRRACARSVVAEDEEGCHLALTGELPHARERDLNHCLELNG